MQKRVGIVYVLLIGGFPLFELFQALNHDLVYVALYRVLDIQGVF